MEGRREGGRELLAIGSQFGKLGMDARNGSNLRTDSLNERSRLGFSVNSREIQ